MWPSGVSSARWVRPGDGVAGRARSPVFWLDLLQSVKSILAALLAWTIAKHVLGLQDPFLAPWSALLVVHPTVYRTFSRGLQQAAATVGGVALAWAAGHVWGLSILSLTVLLVAGFILGRLRVLRAESLVLVTTAVVVLCTNPLNEEQLFLGRLLDTALGIAVGMAVNLIVWPPLRDRAAVAFTATIPDEIGEVLGEIADGLRPDLGDGLVLEWMHRCREVDGHIDAAWGLQKEARESGKLNPRGRPRVARVDDLAEVLHHLEQVVADTLSLARTVAVSVQSSNTWHDSFRERWAVLVSETAQSIAGDNTEALEGVRHELLQLGRELSTDELSHEHWQEYGGLLINLRNVVDAIEPVLAWRRHDAHAVNQPIAWSRPAGR